MTTACKRCGATVRSFSPMRKWCVECRRLISLEQARVRKMNTRISNRSKVQTPKNVLQRAYKLKV